MVNCKQVAKETQSKYGMLMKATQGMRADIETTIQTSVARTSKISIEARRLFCRPN